MQLRKAYIWLHLTEESEEKIKSTIPSVLEPFSLIRQKLLHLTIHYFGDIEKFELAKFASLTNTEFMVNMIRNSVEVSLWRPQHFISNATGESIFYLPARNYYWLFSWLRGEWYTIQTPHVTIYKWQNMSWNVINWVLAKIESIIPKWELLINIQDMFYHGKDENWIRVSHEHEEINGKL